MARKNLLNSLITPEQSPPAPRADTDVTPPSPAQPRRKTGAIGAVSQSLAELRTRALVEVPAELIDDAGLKDRLGRLDQADGALVESIREYGQQVPVLLRHSPHTHGRFEIVYGRRRVAALKALGQPVRAMVRDLSDHDLVVAQGQENAARKDLSFIEKSNFARQMRDAGFDRKVICDALHIDKTVVSRMLNVADSIPLAVIEAIGAAPAAGRDRWLSLAKRIEGHSPDEVANLAHGQTSDLRFRAAFDALAPRRKGPAPARVVRSEDGAEIARIAERAGKTVLTMSQKDEFSQWLSDHLNEIHREFLKTRDE